ncbi:hypothetical protein ACTI_46660 [Actinoplanes sp. OR16]|uniref:DUF4132 domain-containing protein n=1 Tax=Actinoplanes sp. OR16 TaxID=946334 RepID=UPI000F6EBFF4|nr:DUF4132 domain-containing protein [Actinoplanes sp. OR16]BBH67981.1 hypothetical protein ACTI_46660 [Actinoplanes sp. OR16]
MSDAAVMAWEPGERERWLGRAAALDHGREQPDWNLAVTGADKLSDLEPEQVPWLIAKGPEGPARALIAVSTLQRHRHLQRLDLCRVAAARFGTDALPLVLDEVAQDADASGLLVLPFRAPEVAPVVAGWLRHLGSARLWARLWLDRHPGTAAQALIPAARGKASKARQNARQALAHLAAGGHRPIILKTAAAYGMSTPAMVGGLIDANGEDAATQAPLVPSKVDVLRLSRLADPPEPPPGDDVAAVAVESSAAAQPMIADAEPAMEKLLAGEDPAELAAFGRTLLRGWLDAGLPAADAWVVLAQAHIGDDATMDVLAPLVRSWPAKSRWQRAIDGLAVLASVGTDVSLRHLLAIEAGMSGGPTNDRASTYLAQAAARRGLSVTELADRLATTHGLDAGVVLDYGPRRFTVVLDDYLVPARLPKPGAKDTNPGAYQEFLRLKKDLRATVAAQTARLEKEMLTHRRRPASHLRDVVLPHPILGPLARRLVWGVFPAGRGLRIAEDGSFADVQDTRVEIEPQASLGIVHPAELGDELAGWQQLFTDYEILQPFPQLHRPAVTLTPEQQAATSLTGFAPIPTDRVVDMLAGPWQGNGYYSGKRLHTRMSRPLPSGKTLLVELSPGVATSHNNAAAEQEITEVWIDDTWSDHLQLTRRTPMGACDQAALSELLVSLTGSRQ